MTPARTAADQLRDAVWAHEAAVNEGGSSYYDTSSEDDYEDTIADEAEGWVHDPDEYNSDDDSIAYV